MCPLKPLKQQLGVDTISKRNKCFVVRLTDAEMERLDKAVRRTKLSREGYVRTLISGYEPQSLPPVEYYEILHELREIQDTIELLSRVVSQHGAIDSTEYSRQVKRLGEICHSLQTAFVPRKRE